MRKYVVDERTYPGVFVIWMPWSKTRTWCMDEQGRIIQFKRRCDAEREAERLNRSWRKHYAY